MEADRGVLKEFEEKARVLGIKITPQRLAIYQELARRYDHPSVEEVFAPLREIMPGLSMATVYRTLRFFEEKGLIQRVPSVDDKVRYEGEKAPHAHFVCEKCGRIIDLEVDFSPCLDLKVMESRGLSPKRWELVIYGLCSKCTSS